MKEFVDKKIAALIEVREPTVEQCKGCNSDKINYCECYVFPASKWRLGNCVRASHLAPEIIEDKKKRVGQQKQKY